MKNISPPTRTTLLHGVIALAIIAASVALWQIGRESTRELSPSASPNVAASPIQTAPPPSPSGTPMTAGHAAKAPDKTFDWFQRRPFAVARSSEQHEWTEEDGKTPDAILELAHNDLEVQRLMDENERIKRRQLVYRKETVPMLLQRATSDQPLRSFTLPGMDGQEVEVEVTEIHEEPSLHGGSVTGRVKGRFNSMVSVGFVNGYESFNVLSPDDGLFLTADAREPGEVIVKEIDPDKYAPPGGDEPDFILTNQPPPKARRKLTP